MRLLYCELKANNNWFAIYHLHYKKDNLANTMTKKLLNLALERIILINKAIIILEK